MRAVIWCLKVRSPQQAPSITPQNRNISDAHTHTHIHHSSKLVRNSMVRPQISSEAALPGYVR